MKTNFPRLIGIVLLVAVIGAVIWWQFNKSSVVKKELTRAVTNGTDSTYFVRYDSSQINALAGNASFFNVVLQSDSLQKELYSNDTSGFPKTIFNVHIERLSIDGADIPSFLQKKTIQANSIEIFKPVITIINTGKETAEGFSAADSLALYEKITGKFKSIEAKEIKIIDAVIAFAKGKNSPHTNLQGVNINLQNFKIDSTRNYNNMVSYFVKDAVAKIKTATVINEAAKQVYIFNDVEYNAAKRILSVNKILQTDTRKNKTLISLTNTRVTGLSTNAFIYNRIIKADSLITAGGAVGIYKTAQKTSASEAVEIDNKFFDDAIVKNIVVGKTVLTVYNKANLNEEPLTLKNVEFAAANIDSVFSGTDILKLLSYSNWKFKADGISFLTKDKIYNVQIGAFALDKVKRTISVQNISMLPTLSEATFVKSLQSQKDLFNLNFKNILFAGVDLTALMGKKTIIADELTFEPTIKVFNDRTVTPDNTSKLGKYPYQSMMEMQTKFFVKTVRVKNGYVSYRERGAISKNIGDVFFSYVNGTVSNATNIASNIKQNSLMQVNVTTKFLNMAVLNSNWKIPLSATDGSFAINGKLGSFNGTKLNPVIEPLGMGSVTNGNIISYNFNIKGNDVKATGDAVLLYDHLKITLLENKDEKITKKSVTSFVANVLVKDQNPSNGRTRTAQIAFDRVMTKSFFNLVWKSIFDGFKKSLR